MHFSKGNSAGILLAIVGFENVMLIDNLTSILFSLYVDTISPLHLYTIECNSNNHVLNTVYICVLWPNFLALLFSALGKFFSEGDVYRSDVIGPIIEKLRRIRHQMQRQKLYHFFATSVLIVYEGDTKQPTRKPQDLLDVRLVDFAHSFEHHNPRVVGEPDHNTLFGINKLVQYLEQLRIIVK